MQLINVDCSDEHLKLLYRLLGERPEHANISHKEMPSYEEHVLFVYSAPYMYWYIIEDAGHFVGSVYLTRNNELGIAICKDDQGLGYADAGLEMFLATHEPLPAVESQRGGEFIANISPCNDRSIELFKRLGFEHLSNTYRLER